MARNAWKFQKPLTVMDITPFRSGSGSWNFDGNDFRENSNRAFLGVTSEKPKGEEGAKIETEINKEAAAPPRKRVSIWAT